MTIGLERRSYPFLLADQAVWPSGCQFINISQPGITAADAAAYFFRKASVQDIAAIIIYLGNCDANASELKRARFTPFRQLSQQCREALNIKTPKSSLYNKILRYEWNEHSYNPSLEQPESPEDFKYNLRRIVSTCQQRNIPVILIRPKAHELFPAGIGKGNFIYYHYLNLTTKFASLLTHPDPNFLKAYQSYEDGDFEVSRKLYKKILETSGKSSMEYPLLVAHNYALACAQLGKFVEAEVVFGMLLKEWNARQEIFLFNYAMLLLKQADQEGFKSYLHKAYEIDTSMYRVKNSYLTQMDQIAHEFAQNVNVVSMADLDDNLFIDHCHLLPVGQRLMQDRVAAILKKLNLLNGQSRATINNDLLNLELALGNTSRFHDYYKTYAPYSEAQIENDVVRLKEDFQTNGQFTDHSLAFISTEMQRAIEYHRKHPCFTQSIDICRFPPRFSFDIGRFPEYFLVRQMIPYLKAIEQDSQYERLFPASLALLHSSQVLSSILPDHDQIKEINEAQPVLKASEDDQWIRRIISNVERSLHEHLAQGPQCHERLITTIFWYFRETLRFGSHSRYSMRYDRITLEFAAEALSIADWLDSKMGAKYHSQLKSLANTVIEIVNIHEQYAPQFAYDSTFLGKYKLALEGIKMSKAKKDEGKPALI